MAGRIPPDRVSADHAAHTIARTDVAAPAARPGESDHFAKVRAEPPAPAVAFPFGPGVAPDSLKILLSTRDRVLLNARLEYLLGDKHFSIQELAKRGDADLDQLNLTVKQVSAQHKRSWYDPRVWRSLIFGGELESSLAKVNSRVSAAKDWPNVASRKLAQAVQNNDVEAINKWVAAGADPTRMEWYDPYPWATKIWLNDRHWSSPLKYAVRYGSLEAVDALLKAGARIEKFSLGQAAQRAHPEGFIKALVDAGADINETDYYGKTELIHALGDREAKAAKALINAGADLEPNERYAIEMALRADDREFLRLILERMDENQKAKALDAKGRPQNFQLLLDVGGADIAKGQKIERANLSTYESEKTRRIEQELQKPKPNLKLIKKLGTENLNFTNSGVTLLEQAALGGHQEAFNKLLELGADPNWALRSDGVTALHRLAKDGHADVIAIFSNAGANIDQPDANGSTALQSAVENGHIEAVAALLDAGANANRVDKTGRTALHKAVANGNAEIVASLITKKADVNIPDSMGRTALHTAAKNGDIAALSMLLDAGGDINQVDKAGLSPLDDAAKMGKSEAVSFLLLKGAFATSGSFDKSRSYSFIHSLIESGIAPNLDLLKSWIQGGADVYSKNNDGWSIMDWIMGATKPASTFSKEQQELLLTAAMEAQRSQLRQALEEREGFGPSLLAVTKSPSSMEAMQQTDQAGTWNDYLSETQAQALTVSSVPNLRDPAAFRTFLESFDNLRSRLGPISGLLDDVDLDPELRVRAESVKNEIEKAQASIGSKMAELLQQAIRLNDAKAIGLLLRACEASKRKAITQQGLMAAASNLGAPIGRNYLEALQALIDGGAQIHTKDAVGRTPLLAAAEAANSSAIEAVLRLGASPNDKNPAGDTALHLVMRSISQMPTGSEKRSAAISALIQRGADLNATNEKGESIAHLIGRFGHLYSDERQDEVNPELLALLNSPAMQGLRFDVKDASGKTALDYASISENPELYNAMLNRSAKTPATKG